MKKAFWLSVSLTILLLVMTTPLVAQSSFEGKLIIFHAGSLTVPVAELSEAFAARHPGVTFETEASGSNTAARKISELDREADLVISADYRVIDELLIPAFADWNIQFARNTMVIAYTDRSLHAEEITAANWYEILTRDGVIYGHSDPDADPCGYRTLMVWQLAEAYYGIPGLNASLQGHCPPENIRPKSVELIALLQSGDMDYAWEYRSVAVQHGLRFVELPDEINLSRIEHADLYSQATVKIAGAQPGETMTMTGMPIVYGLTIPKNAPSLMLALEFVRFLLGPEGQAIMAGQGQPPIVPPQSAQWERLPSALQGLVAASQSASSSVEVTDALGRTVVFESYPERIVVAGKGAWMVGHPLYLFPEAVDRVLALEARRGTVSPFLSAIIPGFDSLPHLATDAGPEQIAPLKPDAVVLKSYLRTQLGRALETLGLPVVYVDLEVPEQFYRDMRTIGQLFNNPARAEEIASFYQGKVDRIQARIGDLAEQERPEVLLVQYLEQGGEGAFSIPPAEWMQTILVEEAGGRPVWAKAASGSGWQVVNLEQIAAWDPDKILVVVFRADPGPVMSRLRVDPNWSALTAVKNGELYAFPADFYGWDVPDPRWILGLAWCAKRIHPDRFADVDLTDEIYDFYGQMYRMDQAAVEAIVLPQLSGDLR